MEAPRGVVDSLTNTSKPAAELYNALEDGSKLMGKPIYNIKKDETGNISFSFMTKDNGTLAISELTTTDSSDRNAIVYDLTGKAVARVADIKAGKLKAGIYIIGRTKVVVE